MFLLQLPDTATNQSMTRQLPRRRGLEVYGGWSGLALNIWPSNTSNASKARKRPVTRSNHNQPRCRDQEPPGKVFVSGLGMLSLDPWFPSWGWRRVSFHRSDNDKKNKDSTNENLAILVSMTIRKIELDAISVGVVCLPDCAAQTVFGVHVDSASCWSRTCFISQCSPYFRRSKH